MRRIKARGLYIFHYPGKKFSLFRPFPSSFFSLFFFELLHQTPCNIFTLTDIKIHKQSELREMGKLIPFPNNDWSKLVYPSNSGYFLRVPKLRRKEEERKLERWIVLVNVSQDRTILYIYVFTFNKKL